MEQLGATLETDEQTEEYLRPVDTDNVIILYLTTLGWLCEL